MDKQTAVKSRYRIKRTFWKQKDLCYPDIEPILKLVNELGDEYKSAFKSDESDFILFAQKLIEKNLIPCLFKIILVPDNSNPFKRIWNKYWVSKYDLNSENIIQYMGNDEWRKVLADFFIKSSQWIMSWLPIDFSSDLMSLLQKSQISVPSLERKIENSSKINPEPTSSSISEQTGISQSSKDS